MEKLKYIVATIVLLSSLTIGQAQNREIKFENCTLKEAVQLAQKSKKTIFIDCYTSWCGPCKALSSRVFTVDSVADFFNENFINLKMDCEKEGAEVAKTYGVMSYPTLLFIDIQGKILHRVSGYMDAPALLANVNEGLNPETSLIAKKRKFESGITDLEFLKSYFNELNRLSYYDDAELVAKRIISLVGKEDYFNLELWPMISYYSLTRYGSDGWNFLIDNADRFISSVGNDRFCDRFYDGMYSHLFKCLTGHETKKPTKDDFETYMTLLNRFEFKRKPTLFSFLRLAESRTNDSFNSFFKTFVKELRRIEPTEHNRILTNTIKYLVTHSSPSQKRKLHELVNYSKSKQNDYMVKYIDEFHSKIDNAK